jgi:hypothetical protein
VVLIVFPALAFGVVTWLSGSGGLSGIVAGSGSTSSSTTPSASATTTPTETSTPTETATPTPTETTTPPPAPDLTRTVRVENATKTSGLAGGAGTKLKAAGFTAVTTGNWTGAAVAGSTVFYPGPADLGTATKVAEVLGIAAVTEDSALATDRVLVVLEADYQP